MNALTLSLYCEITDGKNRGYVLNYLVAVAGILALVLINIFGKESESINTILSAAIAAAIWGGNQRKAGQGDSDFKLPGRKKGPE